MKPLPGNAALALMVGPLLLAGGCVVGDPDPDWLGKEVVASPGAAEFEVPAGLASGIDDPVPSNELQRGDRVVFGLRLDEAGATRDWFVQIVVVDAHAVELRRRDGGLHYLARVEASVHAADGALLRREVLVLSTSDLTNGLARACRGEEGAVPVASPGFGAVPESVRAALALMNLLKVVRDSEVLFDVLWQVIDKPSLLSVLLHLGVRVSVASHFDRVNAAEPFAAGRCRVPAWELPLELQLNGAPGLRCWITIADPDSPLGLCAGVVALRAFRPSDPTITFTMRLLAARRGKTE